MQILRSLQPENRSSTKYIENSVHIWFLIVVYYLGHYFQVKEIDSCLVWSSTCQMPVSARKSEDWQFQCSTRYLRADCCELVNNSLDDFGKLQNVERIVLSEARSCSGQEDAKTGFDCHISDLTDLAAKLNHNLFDIITDIVCQCLRAKICKDCALRIRNS